MYPNIGSIGNNQNNNTPDCKEMIIKWWSSVPLFMRIIIVTSTFLYLASFSSTIYGFYLYLVNIPANTIKSFRIWTLVTSVLINLSILNLLFAFMSWIPTASKQEMESGTVKYMLSFFLHSTVIQLFYTILTLIIDLIFSVGVTMMPSAGLWPLIMAEITLNCLLNPDNQMMMMFIPFPIKAKYYPWALFGFFTVLSGFQIQFDVLAGILYAYGYFYYLNKWIFISDNLSNFIDNRFPVKYLKNQIGYIPLNGVPSQSGFSVYNPNTSNQRSPSTSSTNTQSTSQTNSNFSPFQGKGVSVGGSPNPNLNNRPNTNPNSYQILDNTSTHV